MDTTGNLCRYLSGLIILSTLLLSSCEKEGGCLSCLDYGSLFHHQLYYSDDAEKQKIMNEYDECVECGMGANRQPVSPPQSTEPGLTNRRPGSVL